MSPKGKHKKNYRKDESSDIHVEDKQFDKKKHRKDKSSDVYGEDKHFEKKKHHKDKSSDIHVDDKSLKKQYSDENQQTEFVYFDPSIIQEVDVFQAPSQQSHVSHENDEVEAVDHVVEAKEEDEMKE
jgi:hypothetical protein